MTAREEWLLARWLRRHRWPVIAALIVCGVAAAWWQFLGYDRILLAVGLPSPWVRDVGVCQHSRWGSQVYCRIAPRYARPSPRLRKAFTHQLPQDDRDANVEGWRRRVNSASRARTVSDSVRWSFLFDSTVRALRTAGATTMSFCGDTLPQQWVNGGPGSLSHYAALQLGDYTIGVQATRSYQLIALTRHGLMVPALGRPPSWQFLLSAHRTPVASCNASYVREGDQPVGLFAQLLHSLGLD